MTELSKTARAAQKAVEAGTVRKKEERSVEKQIADLRLNRESHLACSFTDVDTLLAQYDIAVAKLAGVEPALAAATDAVRAANDEIARLQGEIAEISKINAEVTRLQAENSSLVRQLAEALPPPGQQEHQVIIDEITNS